MRGYLAVIARVIECKILKGVNQYH